MDTWQDSFPFNNDINKDSFSFIIIADLDKNSLEIEDKTTKWKSYIKKGILTIGKGKFYIKWEGEPIKITSLYSELNRGMELSELAKFCNRLWTFDDRTGIVYEITKNYKMIPRFILMEENGNTSKGMKIEWATIYKNHLYIGSIGKEFTNNEGKILNRSGFWIAIIDEEGKIRYEDWSTVYNKIKSALNIKEPGYIIIEAIEWSEYHKRWFVLPRRVSNQMYTDESDEKKGSNFVLSCSENFDDIEVSTVGEIVLTQGFSSFKFVPGTNDRIITAIKSEENNELNIQSSYLLVFDVLSKEIYLETEIPGNMKFEGMMFY